MNSIVPSIHWPVDSVDLPSKYMHSLTTSSPPPILRSRHHHISGRCIAIPLSGTVYPVRGTLAHPQGFARMLPSPWGISSLHPLFKLIHFPQPAPPCPALHFLSSLFFLPSTCHPPAQNICCCVVYCLSTPEKSSLRTEFCVPLCSLLQKHHSWNRTSTQ